MITICPKCALTLTVSAADLRIAQGQVRCGRCLAVFNALLALYDEPPGRRASSRADRTERGSDVAERFDRTDVRDVPAQTPRRAEDAPPPATETALEEPAEIPRQPEPEAPVEQPTDAAGSANDAPPEQAQSVEAHSGAAEDTPSEIIARDIIAAGLVEETVAATDDTGVNPALADSASLEMPAPDPAATDVNIDPADEPAANEPAAHDAVEQETVVEDAAADQQVFEPAAEMPDAANEELIEDLPAANDPFIDDPDAPGPDLSEPAPPATQAESIDEVLVVVAEGVDLEAPDQDFGTVRVIVPASIAAEASAPDEVEPLFQRGIGYVSDTPAELERVEVQSDTPTAAPEEDLAAAAPRRRTALWAAGVALCTLLLGAQLVHVNRAALALHPTFGAAVRDLYARVGLPIAPQWDVSAYDVRQQGAVGASDASAALTVRASIINRSARAQPMPLLRVTLQDRFGNRIALRDLQPREYLPGAKSGGKAAATTPPTLAPGQRVDAEVAMADPGGKAVGFEIDACLQVAAGRYSCANDQAVDHSTTSAAR